MLSVRPDHQFDQPPKRRVRAEHRLLGESQVGESRGQGGEEDLSLEPGQLRADAVVRPGAEGEMAGGGREQKVEAGWVGAWAPSSRPPPRLNPRPVPNRAAPRTCGPG